MTPHTPFKKAAVCLAACFMLLAMGARTAMAQNLGEYAVKAAFIFNFTKFIQWPDAAFADDNAPYHICFLGNQPVEKQFNVLDGKDNGARPIRVRRLDPKSLDEDTTFLDCDILFISRETNRADTGKIISCLKGKPVLIIGETRDFTRMGGVIKFFSKHDRLHFEINTKAAKENHLKFSSRLLKLAVIMDDQ